ncbi:MAG: hypothetical protein MIO93_13625 [ANME-2 cluster archaeon]|jgi:hypothetical protein|nr:hypothetical protein [ANME-2 cluster archaeon]
MQDKAVEIERLGDYILDYAIELFQLNKTIFKETLSSVQEVLFYPFK